jgi:hypothetical protein
MQRVATDLRLHCVTTTATDRCGAVDQQRLRLEAFLENVDERKVGLISPAWNGFAHLVCDWTVERGVPNGNDAGSSTMTTVEFFGTPVTLQVAQTPPYGVYEVSRVHEPMNSPESSVTVMTVPPLGAQYAAGSSSGFASQSRALKDMLSVSSV